MKNLCKKPVILAVFAMMVFVFFSCENESPEEISPESLAQEQFESVKQDLLTEFPESKLISLEELKKMMASKAPSENLFASMKSTGTSSDPQIATMKNDEMSRYYFYGNTLEGPLEGTNLNGELDVAVVVYQDRFKFLKGSYIAGTGEVSDVIGTIEIDGTISLLIELPDNVLVHGVGYENPDNGGLIGRFTMLSTNGEESIGRWLANVKEVETPGETIVDIAINDGRFTTLINALNTTELSDTLRGNGPFTVFAPTDAAFSALDTLPEGDALRDLLLYHVVAGKKDTRAIINNGTLETLLADSTIKIDFNGNGTLVIVNETTQIILSNVEASNGYIHIIDAVLTP